VILDAALVITLAAASIEAVTRSSVRAPAP
jgi:hypothetical protein